MAALCFGVPGEVIEKGKGFYVLKSQIISENSAIIKGTRGHTSE